MLKIKKTYEGTVLTGRIIHDNLFSEARGYWEIKDEHGRRLEEGNIHIEGEVYKNWDGSPQQAFMYIASVLDVEVLEFIDPTIKVVPDNTVEEEINTDVENETVEETTEDIEESIVDEDVIDDTVEEVEQVEEQINEDVVEDDSTDLDLQNEEDDENL
jgi:hypothetical protein